MFVLVFEGVMVGGVFIVLVGLFVVEFGEFVDYVWVDEVG